MKEDQLRLLHYQKTLEKLKSLENIINSPLYDLAQEQKVQVNIRVSKEVAPAMFKSDPLIPGGWIANELTFRAMKKDIFAHIEDMQEEYFCESCTNKIDKQFWIFCPYCGCQFRE